MDQRAGRCNVWTCSEHKYDEQSPAHLCLSASPTLQAPSPRHSLASSMQPARVEAVSEILDSVQHNRTVMQNSLTELIMDEFEDADLVSMQKNLDSQTYPHDLSYEEDMPAYAPVPDLSCSQLSFTSTSSKAEVSFLQFAEPPDPLNILRHDILPASIAFYKIPEQRTVVKNTLEFVSEAFDDEDLQSMQKSRRDTQTCPSSFSCEQLPLSSSTSNPGSMGAQASEDEVSQFRHLLLEDQLQPAAQLPSQPLPYRAPSHEMLLPNLDIQQRLPTSNCSASSKLTAYQATAQVPAAEPVYYDAQACSGSRVDLKLCSLIADEGTDRGLAPQEFEMPSSTVPTNALPYELLEHGELSDMEAVHEDNVRPGRRHKRRTRGRRSGTAKAASHANAVHLEDSVSLSTSASLPLVPPSAKSRQRRYNAGRLWCHLYINQAMLENGFDLVKKLIGREGCNTKEIYDKTSTKVRVRGQGSGHREVRNGQEARVHLMMALAADHGCQEDFKRAFVMAKGLLQDVSKRFTGFCCERHISDLTGPSFWVGESSDESLACLDEELQDIPVGPLELESTPDPE